MDFLPGNILVILVLAATTFSSPASADVVNRNMVIDRSCFDLEWKRGKPFDYYHPSTRESTGTYRGGLLFLVENVHFTNEVRNLIKGSTGSLLGDILFVLDSIPNHPSALDAYSRYEYQFQHSEIFRRKHTRSTTTYPADCFFLRANEVFPNNAETLLVWGIHHFRNKRLSAAHQILKRAVTIAPDYIEAHYNLGLVYVELNNAEDARKHADIAYDAGYPLMGLKNRLAKLEQK